MRDKPLNPRKRPVKWADLSTVVAIPNRAVEDQYAEAVEKADASLRTWFESTLLKWEKAPHGPGILYEDSSAISEDLLFQQNALAVRVTIHVDCEALDANTRTIQGYVEEASAKFKMIMAVYEAGIARGKRKGSAARELDYDYDGR